MEYISLGTDILLEEYFYQIVNSDRLVKPAGGLWTSDFFASSFNEWLDYITNKPMYYTHYTLRDNPFKIKCVIVSLKEGTRIFDMSDNEAIQELEGKYHLDFEKLAEDYDGLYINPYIMFRVNSEHREEYKRLYSVKTLCLFDLEKVQEYKKGMIDVEPFDYTDSCRNEVFYETNVQDGVFQVPKVSVEYRDLLDQVSTRLSNYIYNLVKSNPQYSRNRIAYLISEELKRVFGRDLLAYTKREGLDEERVSCSIATKSLRKIK